MQEERKIIGENRKAHFDYFIEESIECGIELKGTEVKSLKNGSFSFPDSFAEIRNGEVFLRNFHINEYSYSSIFNHNPDRLKKLLLHKEEIKKLIKDTKIKSGITCRILFSMYLNKFISIPY